MAYRNPLPQTNLTITDIRDTLGESTTALSALCKSGKINPFSKAKPVGYNRAFPTASDPLWQGFRGTCGLRVRRELPTDKAPVYTTDPDSFHVDKIPNITCYNWVHNPPSGGAAQPFRMGDFRGYNHTADPFIRVSTPKSEFATINRYMPDPRTSVNVMFDVLRGSECPPDVLSVEDLTQGRKAYAEAMEWPDKYYPCVQVSRVSGSTILSRYWFFASDPLSGQGSEHIEVPVQGLDIGTYRFSCFLSNTKTTPIDYFFPIPWSADCPVTNTLTISSYFPAYGDVVGIAEVPSNIASNLMDIRNLDYREPRWYEQNNQPLRLYGFTNFALKIEVSSQEDVDLDKSKFWVSLGYGVYSKGRLFVQGQNDAAPSQGGAVPVKGWQEGYIYLLYRGDSWVLSQNTTYADFYDLYVWYGSGAPSGSASDTDLEFAYTEYLYLTGN